MKNGCVVDELGNKCWFKDAELHREDGPAIEHLNGSKEWYKDGKLHREDGPAVEYRDGSKGWYLNGKSLGSNVDGFWELWDRLTDEQRGNTTLLKYLPR